MDASTGGSAHASGCARRSLREDRGFPARAGAHCHPETFISAVTRPAGTAQRMSVADDCRKVDA